MSEESSATSWNRGGEKELSLWDCRVSSQRSVGMSANNSTMSPLGDGVTSTRERRIPVLPRTEDLPKRRALAAGRRCLDLLKGSIPPWIRLALRMLEGYIPIRFCSDEIGNASSHIQSGNDSVVSQSRTSESSSLSSGRNVLPGEVISMLRKLAAALRENGSCIDRHDREGCPTMD